MVQDETVVNITIAEAFCKIDLKVNCSLRHSFDIQANQPCRVILGGLKTSVNVEQRPKQGLQILVPLIPVGQVPIRGKFQMQDSSMLVGVWIRAAAGV
jgi:hypothetical protein